MAIVVAPTTGLIAPSSSSSTSILWNFKPSSIFKKTWKVGTPFASVFPIITKIPAYELMSAYSGYTDFELNIGLFHGTDPQWLKIEGALSYSGTIGTEVSENGITTYEKELEFSYFNFNLLSLGTHFATAIYTVSAVNPSTSIREDIISQGMYFQLEVVNTDVEFLDVTWNLMLVPYMYFQYYAGGDLPTLNTISVFHNVPFTVSVSDSLLLVSETAYDDFTLLDVSFDSGVSSLAVGIHNFQITLNYGTGLTKIIDVQLEVIDTSDSFYVNPTAITFEAYRNAAAPAAQIVNTISPAVWNINSSLPIWLSSNVATGNGMTDVYLQAVNFNDLPAGNYTFNLEFTTSTETKTVIVTLILHDFLNHPFVTEKLAFTQELDYLDFNSDVPEPTFIEIELDIKVFSLNLYEEIAYPRSYKLPLYKGVGQFHIGDIVHQLLEEIESLGDVVPLQDSNYSKTQYAPAEVSVSFAQKNYESYEALRSGTIELIKFVKGHKPFVTDGQLSLLTVMQQEVSRITPKSVIGIGFTHFGNPLIRVLKNGILIEETNVLSFSTVPEKLIYSHYRFTNNFKLGDIIEIQILNNLESRIQRFLVLTEGVDSTYFLFENDNGIVEPFEFSGRVRVNNAYTHITNKVFKNLFEIDKKFDSWNNQSIVVNTGHLLPSDHKIIDAIIKSKKVWCAFNDPSGRYLLVDSTSTKMTPSDTFKQDNSYDVEFNILEDANATVYPQ